ncbi:hypothetical protein QE152_g29881 [Popillia japonica]|uniref:Uncharacterized protein n=1 Tax=Popillia japonica TaxID=7064 RepID=A0AAW1JGP2_POPJA
MESPVRKQLAEVKPGTPRYLVSPGTVKFLEERCRTPPPALPSPGPSPLPSPPVLHIASPVSPNLSLFSPGTENFIQWKFIELFGFSPVKEWLSPMPPTPPSRSEDTGQRPTGATVDNFVVSLARYRPPSLPSPLPGPSREPSKPASHPTGGVVKRRNRGPAWKRHRKNWVRHEEPIQLQVRKCSASDSAV